MFNKQRLLPLICMSAAVAALTACERAPRDDAAEAADIVLQNGRIYTVDESRSWAEAIAVRNGRIAYVGDDAGAEAFVGAQTTVVDLDARLLLPGFQDSHVHPILAGIQASACDLSGVNDLDGYRRTILEYATANPDVPWILGGGWAMSVFGPGGAPDKSILDELVPDRPVYLVSQDGHTAWANSVALEIAGIGKDTPDPPDGRIDRDPQSGEAIGSLQEGAADLVERHIPEITLEDRLGGLRYAVELLNGYGITSIQDAIVYPADLDAYKALEAAGELSMRVVGSLWWQRERGMEQIPDHVASRDKYTGGLIDSGTIKIMQDGVMENYTAVMLEPYLVPSKTRGVPMVDPDRLRDIVAELDRQDFQVHFHAIGDGAVRQTLDAVEEALIENGQRGNRHHISHLQMIDPADIPRFRELEVTANFQPLWAYPDEYVTELTIPFIGEERARWMYPIRSVLDSGARVAFGSDWSVSTANPFPQIETAMTRMDVDSNEGDVLFPEERIDLASALAAFTINAAYINRHDDETGSLEAGKLADFAVLDQNLFEIPAADISETKVLLTVFGGRAVHGSFEDL